MSRNNQPRTVIQSMLRTPNNPATLPDNTGATALRKGIPVTTGTNLQGKEDIGDLITHVAKSDNHLWQALTSLQRQANGLVNNTSNWTSWVPHILNDVGDPVSVTNDAAYFMTYGPLLFIELHTDIDMTPPTYGLQVNLPIDVGSIVIKTCAAYLVPDVQHPDINAVLAVEIFSNVAVIAIDTSVVGITCRFMMGGAIAIL